MLWNNLELSGHNEPQRPSVATWRMNHKWSGNSFLLSSSSLANHGDYLSCLSFHPAWWKRPSMLLVGKKNSPSLCINHLLHYLVFYLSTFIWVLFHTKSVTKVKPNINSVEVHPQLSNNRHSVHGALVGVGVQCGQVVWGVGSCERVCIRLTASLYELIYCR
jgi:hypothetical protein